VGEAAVQVRVRCRLARKYGELEVALLTSEEGQGGAVDEAARQLFRLVKELVIQRSPAWSAFLSANEAPRAALERYERGEADAVPTIKIQQTPLLLRAGRVTVVVAERELVERAVEPLLDAARQLVPHAELVVEYYTGWGWGRPLVRITSTPRAAASPGSQP
jgi:hypothetical protein